MIKNPLANPGDRRDVAQSLGWEEHLEEGVATHFSILVWRIPIHRGARQTTYDRWGCKESDMTEAIQHKPIEKTKKKNYGQKTNELLPGTVGMEKWRRNRLYKKPQVNLGGYKNILYLTVT